METFDVTLSSYDNYTLPFDYERFTSMFPYSLVTPEWSLEGIDKTNPEEHIQDDYDQFLRGIIREKNVTPEEEEIAIMFLRKQRIVRELSNYTTSRGIYYAINFERLLERIEGNYQYIYDMIRVIASNTTPEQREELRYDLISRGYEHLASLI